MLFRSGFSVGTPQSVTGVAINAPASAQFRIGNYLTNSYPTAQYFTGYISNLRFVKGTAVYTANFTPPTGPLQNIANTSLLTCQSPTIIDNSSSPLTITNNNSVVVSSNAPFTAYNPFAQNPALGASTPGLWTLPQAMQAVQNRTWAMYDPYYNYVTLNLHGNGANTAQNNTFLDSSLTNNTITRNGNTTQGAFSPYRSYWGAYTTGATYFSLAQNSNYDLVSTDFTIEFWFNPLAFNTMTYAGSNIGGNALNSGSSQGWFIGFDGSGTTEIGRAHV